MAIVKPYSSEDKNKTLQTSRQQNAGASGFAYAPFQTSEQTQQAEQKRQQVQAQKPADFSYQSYTPSSTVQQAQALLQQQLAQKPGAYQSQWQANLDEIMDRILNREDFSYDVNRDALYQQYKDQYVNQGQLAMMDTMGQAAALTGGYGNSYAQNAGQQAYQGHLQQLNAVVPELYGMALDQYNREWQALYDQYGLYADRENLDYGRYRDSVSDYYTELDRLTEDARYREETEYGRFLDQYNQAYGQHRDQIADWQQEMALADEEYWNQYNRDYGQYIDDRDFSYSDYLNALNHAYQQDRDAVADRQWQTEFDEAKRQYDQEYAFALQQYLDAQRVSSGSSDTGGSVSTSSGGQPTTGNVGQPATGSNTGGYDTHGYTKAQIMELQENAGITVDGIWGPDTEKAYQSGYRPNGSDSDPTYDDVVSDLNMYINNGANKEQIDSYISSAYYDGIITRAQYQHLKGNFAPKMQTYR